MNDFPFSQRITKEQTFYVYPQLLTFDRWLEESPKEGGFELVDGMLQERAMVQLEPAKLETWFIQVVGGYIQERKRGILLHSRSPVRIGDYRGRMPDLFFVQESRLDIVGQKATTEAPDLVIEIISPGDRPSDVRSLETDYRTIGVSEIVFLDLPKRRARVLQREETSYTDQTISSGEITFRSLGLTLPLDWLFIEPRPALRPTLAYLLGETTELPPV